MAGVQGTSEEPSELFILSVKLGIMTENRKGILRGPWTPEDLTRFFWPRALVPSSLPADRESEPLQKLKWGQASTAGARPRTGTNRSL